MGASQKSARPCASRCASQPRIQALSSGSPRSPGSARVACAASGHVMITASAANPATTSAMSTTFSLLVRMKAWTWIISRRNFHPASLRTLYSPVADILCPREEHAMIRNRLYRWAVLAAVIGLAAGLPLRAASEKINYEDITKIRAEGMQRSQVMEIMSYLTDVYGPRLTGSPNIQKAGEWAVAKMKEWGLTNVAMEPWANRRNFDRGWSNDKFYMAAVSPQSFPIVGTPTAWTPGTNGLVRADVVLVTATTEEELAQYKGKLTGKWVLAGAAPDVPAYWTAPSHRYTTDELDAIEPATLPGPEFGLAPPGGRGGRGGPGAPAGTPQQAAAAGRQGGPGGPLQFFQIRNDFFRAE